MGARRTALIPLIGWTEGHGHLLEVIFERHLRLLPARAFSLVAVLEQAGVPFAAEAEDAAHRYMETTHHNPLFDVGAVVANSAANLAGHGVWLGLALGMVSALNDDGALSFVATGDLMADGGAESRIAPADRHHLALKLAVVIGWLERREMTGAPIAVVIPAMVDGGEAVRSSCPEILAKVEQLGGIVLPVASLAEAVDRVRMWTSIPSRT